MGIFRKVDKILAAFGNIKALERTHVDTYTENRIRTIKGTKIAQSKEGELWVRFESLAGYEFLNTTLLSHVNLSTHKGGKLLFTTEKELLELSSDTTTIESDYSNVSNCYITELSFVVSKEEINFIERKKANTVQFHYKKKQLSLTII